jgi:site-specific DNA recombinase
LELEVHFVKENVILTKDSRSSEKFMHGIKVLVAKNYIDNLSEEVKKGLRTKAAQNLWPSFAPLGYSNTAGGDGERIIVPDPVFRADD